MVRFCVLTTQRSGSTWFVDLLNSQPGACAYSEVFRQAELARRDAFFETRLNPPSRFLDYRRQARLVRPFSTWGYLRRLESFRPSARACGFKLMYNQLLALPELVPAFCLLGHRILHVVRLNPVDTAVSRAALISAPQPHSDREPGEPVQLDLDPAEFLSEIARIERNAARVRRLLRRLPLRVAEIHYERLCENACAELRRVLGFLDVAVTGEEVVLDSPFRKMIRGPRRKVIRNYDEIRRALAGTAFARYLEED
ncbi:sulfotransferase [Verrucomicrobiota bacterium]